MWRFALMELSLMACLLRRADKVCNGWKRTFQTQGKSVNIPVCSTLVLANYLRMNNFSTDVTHLRELADKCRRVAATLTDENDISSLRQMAAEYDGMANRIEHPPMWNLQRPSSL
jgi:hypothetical protein